MDSAEESEDAAALSGAQRDSVSSHQPDSYCANSAKEQLLLSFTDNFTRQFKKLYGDRKPQFLRPLNECGVEKFVCTTLRPTCLPIKELYDWDGCASFVADYVTCCPLYPPDELPKELPSPTLVLDRQEGSSFDLSCLLCSLLLGVGYDAYCVSGYAVREVTEVDQRDKTCPLLEQGDQVDDMAVEDKSSHYIVRPPRDLNSQFERRQEAKARAEEERKRREQELANAPAEEEPEVDKYHGLRVHCWVLVLSGKREVAQNFFIEATTGESQPVDSELYLGIESLWNHQNYWINMQDCAHGLKNMVYDLGDATKWEFFFPNVEQPLLVVPEDSSATVVPEEGGKQTDDKEDFELPPSWVLPLHISSKDFETRCPHGKRTTLYHKSRLEKFADYLNSNGLVSRLTLYSDTARRCKVETRCLFHHREDQLLSRVEDSRQAVVHEKFGLGRQRALMEHTYSSVHSNNRTMLFYSNGRVDGLSKRELTASEMVEHFEQRPDLLFYRHTSYTRPASQRDSDQHCREIKSIVERFHHNPALPHNNDVAERQFQLTETTFIRVTYHLEPGRITASYRQFLTPTRGGEQAYNLTFDPQAISGYQVDPYAAEPKSQHLFQQLESLMEAQEDAVTQVRASENEVAGILRRREEEEASPTLTVSVYDVTRNQKAFQQREEEEAVAREEERLQREKERDYLSPFIGRLVGHSGALDLEQKAAVTEECLKDKRQSLVDKANMIQARFDTETEALSRKQAWYKANQSSLTRDSEADYIAYCNEALFRIHILEQRLNIHKSTAPEKYLQLERRLREDPRLRGH